MAKYEITYVDGSKEIEVVEADGYTNKNEWVAFSVVGDSQKVRKSESHNPCIDD